MAPPGSSDPLPQLLQAPLQYQFRRLEDFCCWTYPLFRLHDCDPLIPRRRWDSSHRSLSIGAISLCRTDYGAGVRLECTLQQGVLFTFNASGQTHFRVNNAIASPAAGAGVLMVTPCQGHYIREAGGGILLSCRPETLLQTAQAIGGPKAARRLQLRLGEPLRFFAYDSGAEPSLPGGLLRSLHLANSLLGPRGTVPAALCLDDLICRQLVLMLCPELAVDDDAIGPVPASSGFELLLEWLSSHVAEPHSLSQLEARSGYSRRALQRAFQQRFGCGPMQWLRRRRLALALEQLSRASTADSVSSVARRCGYLSLASFSRDFQRAYGRQASDVLRANQGSPG
ncbi:MAG: AraC family transcriptional regulator [Cyanobacteriota bacterium]|nr:AraC family transcriptional regulator [Cyanobacteriota bacterium]